MDIKSGAGYPASALSNFAPHAFTVRGVECASMEGFLQSLKFKNPDMQREVCKLVGKVAKARGAKKNWQRTQTLYWQGEPIQRGSVGYQSLLDDAYAALAQNVKFQKALLATGKATLTHSIGRKKQAETVLTVQEFCSRLTEIRDHLQNESNERS
ncbi:hypothetical protein AVU32_gp191 [Vibrio phage ValKK3]|uniref:Uncharacterized protein n=1 Tax=Vibrio phage ValKK3 TaxID=1610855 RepID=A0A0D4DBL2_9CAUD|nr:hypothetical protein AVU32_gp191 [Vibrio phage ValKK3]AJT61032.1 hypothetical protein [Vibrio phage ValKK3]